VCDELRLGVAVAGDVSRARCHEMRSRRLSRVDDWIIGDCSMTGVAQGGWIRLLRKVDSEWQSGRHVI